MLVTLILFIINTLKFINDPALEIQILSILFIMILYLGIIIFILHKKVIPFYEFINSEIDNNKKEI